jgi:hypothetical protein
MLMLGGGQFIKAKTAWFDGLLPPMEANVSIELDWKQPLFNLVIWGAIKSVIELDYNVVVDSISDSFC